MALAEENSRKMAQEGRNFMTDKKSSDQPTKKQGRGRPREIDPRTVVESADHYRIVFLQFWPKLGARLLAAQSPEEVAKAVREEAPDISASLDRYSELILKIVNDPKFPRARSKSQIHFLADSLGGHGFVTPRRSREICAEERTKKKYFIVRREYYIECSCGYKGPALDGACRDCGTEELSWDLMMKEND
ncbi:MAG: hypothetical protein ABSG40_17005 [Terriglobales bacterium]|jgi:hypothetical protein